MFINTRIVKWRQEQRSSSEGGQLIDRVTGSSMFPAGQEKLSCQICDVTSLEKVVSRNPNTMVVHVGSEDHSLKTSAHQPGNVHVCPGLFLVVDENKPTVCVFTPQTLQKMIRATMKSVFEKFRILPLTMEAANQGSRCSWQQNLPVRDCVTVDDIIYRLLPVMELLEQLVQTITLV